MAHFIRFTLIIGLMLVLDYLIPIYGQFINFGITIAGLWSLTEG